MLRPLSPPRASISAYRTCDKKVYSLKGYQPVRPGVALCYGVVTLGV